MDRIARHPSDLAARVRAVLALLAVAGLGSACGGTAASPSVAAPATSTVKVTLQEFAVVPDVASVPAGTVTFIATNTGPDDVHELVVIKTDLGLLDLPTDADGKVLEDGAGMEVIGEVEDVEVGASKEFVDVLAAGRYLLICNILQTEPDGSLEAHYKMGMVASFEVTAP
ncbi:MAG: hypothetical protein ABIP77_03640 [Candidatus Limnocylindrales bacterium]